MPHSGIASDEKIEFASEIQGARLRIVESVIRLCGKRDRIFFSNGSFGDHVLHVAVIYHALQSRQQSSVALLYPKEYYDFYKYNFSQCNGVTLVPLDGYIVSTLDAYFIHSAEWLKGYFPIIPLLPIYYPIIPFAVEWAKILSHLDAIKAIARVGSDIPFERPKYWSAVEPEIRKRVNILFGNEVTHFLIISPGTNSVDGLPKDFWISLIEAISTKHNIILNADEKSFESPDLPSCVKLTHFEPHLILPAISLSLGYIGAAHGLSNMAKLYCKVPQVLVADYRDEKVIKRKGLSSVVPAANQIDQHLDKAIIEQFVVKYRRDDERAAYINQIYEYIS